MVMALLLPTVTYILVNLLNTGSGLAPAPQYFKNANFLKTTRVELNRRTGCLANFTDKGVAPNTYKPSNGCPDVFASIAFAKWKCAKDCNVTTLSSIVCLEVPRKTKGERPEEIFEQWQCNTVDPVKGRSKCTTKQYTWLSVERAYKQHCGRWSKKPSGSRSSAPPKATKKVSGGRSPPPPKATKKPSSGRTSRPPKATKKGSGGRSPPPPKATKKQSGGRSSPPPPSSTIDSSTIRVDDQNGQVASSGQSLAPTIIIDSTGGLNRKPSGGQSLSPSVTIDSSTIRVSQNGPVASSGNLFLLPPPLIHRQQSSAVKNEKDI